MDIYINRVMNNKKGVLTRAGFFIDEWMRIMFIARTAVRGPNNSPSF